MRTFNLHQQKPLMKHSTQLADIIADAMKSAYNWNNTLADIAAIYARPDTRTLEQIADDDAYSLAEYNCLTSAEDRERDEFRLSQINYKRDPIYREVPDGSRARKH